MPSLIHVDFNLTNACNLACSHCHSASGQALPHELTTEEIVDAVRQLHGLGALSIAFAGGEPFMRRDLVDILAEACGLDGWRVSVITNGLFLTDVMLAQLLDRCPTVEVNVSVDGSHPETFGDLRAQPKATPAARAALFGRVTDGVRRAVAAGLRVSVNTTITRATRDDLVPTYKFATDELGAQAVVAIKFFPAGYGRDHLERYDFPFPVWSAYFQELTRARLDGELPLMQLSVPTAWEFYLPLIEGGIDLATAETAWRYRSPLRERTYAAARAIGDVAGFAELCVSGDGSVYPSVLMVDAPGAHCGSVRERSLADIWTSSPVLTRLRGLSPGQLEGTCSTCDLLSLCGGGSRSRAFADHGRLDGADSHCPFNSTSLVATGSAR